MTRANIKGVKGFSLIEVLITLLILMTGLLGLAGLQGRALTSQLESYQRSQALILVKDMEDRLNANRANAASYITNPTYPSPLGVGYVGCTTTTTTTAARDLCEWNYALQGSAEGATLGAMIGARGCIYRLSAAVPNKYLIAIAWQGLTRTAAPGVDCGLDSYGSNDALRRVITIPITIANLN
ncbi:MAG TPA: type IV pilus modification protein PilV [Methylotenera sp.]|nr:type IV pilus modification protein PilV [Methylotenera sp.]